MSARERWKKKFCRDATWVGHTRDDHIAIKCSVWMLNWNWIHHTRRVNSEKKKLIFYLLTAHAIEGTCIICDICIQVSPKFHQEKCILWSFVVQIFKSASFLREFVDYLLKVYRLQNETKRKKIKRNVFNEKMTPPLKPTQVYGLCDCSSTMQFHNVSHGITIKIK